jgi:hypothetical protein
MARFHDLLASLTEEQVSALPEGIIDTLTGEYDNDLSLRDAAVAERETRIAEANALAEERASALLVAKAAHYDLLMATPAPNKQDDGADDDDDDPDEPSGIDALFGTD